MVKPRPPASDEAAERMFQWYFDAIPATIRYEGADVPNPFRERAFYVVHGMGEQSLTDTSAQLRRGLEASVPLVDPGFFDAAGRNRWVVPEPFVFDGFWGHYPNIERFAPESWDRFTDRERSFFSRVWHDSAVSFTRTWRWFLNNTVTLIVKAPLMAKVYYLWILPQALFTIGLMWVWPKTRPFVIGYLNDVRMFIEPHGDMERYIAQRIEHLVGERFLQMLGLDWDLEPLSPMDQIDVSGTRRTFRRVCWVSHSLGTVVSYKVIGDLLRKALQLRTASGNGPPPDGVLQLERGLASFVTLGSPLDKIKYLYPDSELVADWPSEYLPGGPYSLWNREGHPERFWLNFHYTSDPVSGRLDSYVDGEGRNLVHNFHPRGRHLLLASHVAYWRDPHVVTQLLSLAFDQYVKPWPPARVGRSPLAQFIQQTLAAAVYGVLLPVLLFGLIWYLLSLTPLDPTPLIEKVVELSRSS